MFLLLLLLGTVRSAPLDEFQTFVNNEEVAFNDEAYIKYIVPSGYSPHKSQKQSKVELLDFANKDNEHYEILKKHILAGSIKNGLTFNIYDDNMREASIALFRLLQYSEKEQISKIKEWALENINHDIIDYAWRLVSLYRTDVMKEQEPPYVSKPNYFINSEAIYKALKLKISNGKFDSQTASVQQFYRSDDVITINANYSGWNLLNEDCNDKLDYFREDIGLNSYYYGVHLQYPFWMNNDELTGIDPKYAEQYYYIHKQLMARYSLEKEHPDYNNSQFESKCYEDFIPYLVHDNGLNFAVRSTIKKENSEEYARLKSVDIAIRECIARGFIYMENSTRVTLTDENFVDLLSKLIRVNLESVSMAKIIRSLYGYGGKGYFKNALVCSGTFSNASSTNYAARSHVLVYNSNYARLLYGLLKLIGTI
ncbi:arylphorin subunit alpha [Danaus plexippus plexippus]|uniref:Arylphorin subunit alpha n=1 Tax=Danaus plexippus plexippus TaxID=278856 RepID=A0A212ENJ7_DANPL|nr:arylphorin subunit alpha [Danaus plexippus plexippus]